MKVLLFTLLFVILASTVNAQIPDWFVKLKRLQEFASNEKDIEILFNSPKVSYTTFQDKIRSGDTWMKLTRYELPEGELEVLFSAGKCSDQNIKG